MGYAIARMRWRLKRVALGAIGLGMVVPIHATLLPNFLWYSRFGLIDTRLGLILPYVAFTLSINTLVYAGHFRNLPVALEAAALVDGASWARMLLTTAALLARPPTVSGPSTTCRTNWSEFTRPNTCLTSDELRTLRVSIIRFQDLYSGDYA